MTTKLYLIALPDAQTSGQNPPGEGVTSRVQAQGLLQGGLATENIATEAVDLRVRGRFMFGEFSKKLHRELKSLGESTYESVPFADDDNVDSDDQSGYYEVRDVNSTRANEASALAYQYDIALDAAGTRNTHWRAVRTGIERVDTRFAGTHTASLGESTYGGTPYADATEGIESPAYLGIATEATKVRWFDTAQGTESATIQETVNAEFGDVDLYDPAEPSFRDPTLIYELPFDREGPVDVRVWDDVGAPNSKQLDYDDDQNNTYSITQWVHAYHSGFEFEGQPILDNGLLRVRFDEGNGTLEAWEWNESGSSWDSISISMGDWTLFDADIERIGPADVQVFTEFENSTSGSVQAVVLSLQRGSERAIIREPDNGSIPTGLDAVLVPIASAQTGDYGPAQTTVPRQEVK